LRTRKNISINDKPGVYRLENTPPPRGGKISADIIWGKNMKREDKKGEDVKEKGKSRKEKGRKGKKRIN
jgi:hypothetical protein